MSNLKRYAIAGVWVRGDETVATDEVDMVLASAHDAAMGELQRERDSYLATIQYVMSVLDPDDGSGTQTAPLEHVARRVATSIAALSAELEKARALLRRWRDPSVSGSFGLRADTHAALSSSAAIDSTMAALSTHPGNGREVAP